MSAIELKIEIYERNKIIIDNMNNNERQVKPAYTNSDEEKRTLTSLLHC